MSAVMRFFSHSSDETQKIAADFARSLVGGELIALVGELGSGKTTFVRGLAEALGATAAVKSPTFTLVNLYPTTHEKIELLVHADFYRIGETNGTYHDLGLDEFLKPENIVCVEWPPVKQRQKPPFDKLWTVLFEHGAADNERTIKIRRGA